MKNAKISRRSFLKAGAVASAVGMLSAAPVAAHAAETDASTAADEENGLLDVFKKPKYVFLFIGDGMGTAQIQSARFYKGTVDNNGAVTEADLSFTSFPHVGSVTTYDSTSFCPDSASTATSIATGHKTESGVINMCPWTRDVPYETIAEKLHAQKGYKVGVISTVNIDHATPAAFYAHQKTRKNYYEIGVELANSGFEYFAGGEFQKVNGDGTGPDNHTVAANADQCRRNKVWMPSAMPIPLSSAVPVWWCTPPPGSSGTSGATIWWSSICSPPEPMPLPTCALQSPSGRC